MRRIFMTKAFQRLMKKSGLKDEDYCRAVAEMERGLVDADLGGGIVKKRIALPGRGKSAGARTLLVTNRRNRWFFVYGFRKNDRDNISPEELVALKLLAVYLLPLADRELDIAMVHNELTEICHEQKN